MSTLPDRPARVSPAPAPPTFVEHANPIPWAEFRERVLALYKPPLRASTSYYSTRRTFDLLEQLGGIETTSDLTMALIARFVESRRGQENPNTTRTHLRKLSAACSIAVGEGWLRVSPFMIRKSWVRPVAAKQPRVHSREEICRVLELARDEIGLAYPRERWKARRLYAVVATLAYTGMRKMEVLRLRVEDVRLKDRMILLQPRRDELFKTEGSAQPVPIPPPLLPILRGWLGHLGECPFVFPNATGLGPWVGGPHGKKATDVVKALAERAGVPGFTFQSLRHSWATHAEYWGLTDAMIQRLLRHTNLKTQWHYRHAEAENLRSMVDAVRFDSPPPSAEPGNDDHPQQAQPLPVRLDQADAAMVDYRSIAGFPRHRLGSDGSVWTNLRRDGHERPGDPPGPWRRLNVLTTGGNAGVVNLRRDGRTCQRTLAALMREVFGDGPMA